VLFFALETNTRTLNFIFFFFFIFFFQQTQTKTTTTTTTTMNTNSSTTSKSTENPIDVFQWNEEQQKIITRNADAPYAGMMQSALLGDLDLAKHFEAQGAKNMNDAMFAAITNKHLEMVKFCVSKGANDWQDAINAALDTPQSLELLGYLLETGYKDLVVARRGGHLLTHEKAMILLGFEASQKIHKKKAKQNKTKKQ